MLAKVLDVDFHVPDPLPKVFGQLELNFEVILPFETSTYGFYHDPLVGSMNDIVHMIRPYIQKASKKRIEIKITNYCRKQA